MRPFPASASLHILVLPVLLFGLLNPIAAEANPLQNKQLRSVQVQNRAIGSFFRKPSYELPFSDWEYTSSGRPKRSFFVSDPKPSPQMLQLITVVRKRAEHISGFGLKYKFGGDHPSEGGMDCSGTMKFMLSDIGFESMPRTSYNQYEWLRKHRTLTHSKTIPAKMGGRQGIDPGDLIFWGGTYDSGHKVSHVMIYLGQSGNGTHYMFGARGKKKKGLYGSGVDIFELNSGYQKSLIGFGSLPGVF